jgi:hypothetical protein
MLSDGFYYVLENGGISVKLKGNPIIEHDGVFDQGGIGADDFIFNRADHFIINDFHQSEGDQLVFGAGTGLVTRDQLMSYVTDMHFTENDFIVNFGNRASITLVGVHEGEISIDDVVVAP